MGYIHVCIYIYINNYYESTEEKKTQATPTMRLNKASRVYAVCAHRLPNGRSEAVGFEERPYIRAAPDRHNPPNLPFSSPPPTPKLAEQKWETYKADFWAHPAARSAAVRLREPLFAVQPNALRNGSPPPALRVLHSVLPPSHTRTPTGCFPQSPAASAQDFFFLSKIIIIKIKFKSGGFVFEASSPQSSSRCLPPRRKVPRAHPPTPPAPVPGAAAVWGGPGAPH